MKVLTMPVRKEAPLGTVPQIWATDGNLANAVALMEAEPGAACLAEQHAKPKVRVLLTPEMAFYRKYTEGMLRRYATLRMESGRVPSLLGRTLFRGKVSSYRVHGFDDVVIFVHDVEQCVRLLTPDQQRLIHRIAVQEYTFAEASQMLRQSLRSTKRWYTEAIDELTGIFLQRKLLERVLGEPCQGAAGSAMLLSYSPKESYDS